MTEEIVLTREGKKKLEAELDNLINVKRAEVSERIKQAKSFGDLSENSEYDDAKNEQGFVETRIMEIQTILDHAEVVAAPRHATKVVVGTTVTLKPKGRGAETDYHIVGSAEADPTRLAISNESPVGSALIGHKKGDVVEVKTPRGTKTFEIINIAPLALK
ncbi:MAG: transcription elongation factor GreA [Actinomycetia bacterium]|nr:transcription elongation factor GreA [Actinomycetes bacterium]